MLRKSREEILKDFKAHPVFPKQITLVHWSDSFR